MFKKTSTIEIDNIDNFNSKNHCFYCGCYDNQVDSSGIKYCPNPKCHGPGAIWFNKTLWSFEECDDGYMIDENEKNMKADEYMRNNKEEFIFIDKNKIRKKLDDKNQANIIQDKTEDEEWCHNKR